MINAVNQSGDIRDRHCWPGVGALVFELKALYSDRVRRVSQAAPDNVPEIAVRAGMKAENVTSKWLQVNLKEIDKRADSCINAVDN